MMNLEQIVKETVAKVVAEKKGKDLNSDGKIDSKDYLQARSNAIKKAKNISEDYEVAMAQDSLDSIIRAAMMLKSQMGDQEVNLPAWIQDHITNSENYINQASKGYHESDAQIDDEAGTEEMNEVRVPQYDVVDYLANNLQIIWNAGKGNNSINFQDFAQSLYFDMFGHKGINEANLGHNEISSIGQEGRFWVVTYQTVDGTKEKSFESKDKARKFYNSLDKTQDISNDELAQLQATADDTSKMPAERDAARNKIYTSRTKEKSQELDEWTISRWQHYAGIK